MKLQEKMDRVEAETILLMAYMDNRAVPADIGLSTLISVLVTVTAALDIPMESVMQAVLEARTLGDEMYFRDNKVMH